MPAIFFFVCPQPTRHAIISFRCHFAISCHAFSLFCFRLPPYCRHFHIFDASLMILRRHYARQLSPCCAISPAAAAAISDFSPLFFAITPCHYAAISPLRRCHCAAAFAADAIIFAAFHIAASLLLLTIFFFFAMP